MAKLDLFRYNGWIRGTAAVAAKDNFTAMKIFKEIRLKYNLLNCVSLLYSLGTASTNYGYYSDAIEAFKLVRFGIRLLINGSLKTHNKLIYLKTTDKSI